LCNLRIILALSVQVLVTGINCSVNLEIAYLPFLIDFFSVREKFFPQRWASLFGPGFDLVLAILPWNGVIEGSDAVTALVRKHDMLQPWMGLT
jgi:hypothetical protein